MFQHAKQIYQHKNIEEKLYKVNAEIWCNKMHMNTLRIGACNESNLMHYLSLVYSVTIPLHVSS
jgi:hypothetical protein